MKKSTLFVVLLAAVLGSVVWYFEFRREKPAEDSAAASKPLFSFQQDDIVGVTLRRSDQTIAFEKKEKDWRITRPLDSATDSAAVDALLSSIASARLSRTIDVSPPASPEKLKEFGLDAPAVTLFVKLKAGAEHRLRLGAKDFTGGYVYALTEAAAGVALLPDDILTNSDKPLLDFRDRRIAIFDQENIARLRVRNQHGALVAEKNAEGKWQVVSPVAKKGREVEASRILNALENARASEILDSPTPADRARLVRPAVEVELSTRGGHRIEVALSSGKQEIFVRSSLGPMLFKTAQSILDSLNFKPEDIIKKEEPKKEELPAKEKNQ